MNDYKMRMSIAEERFDTGEGATLVDEKSKSGISRRTFLAGLAGATLLRLPLQPAEALPMFDPFSFVFVSDVHLVNGIPDTGEKMLQESQLFLQEAIKHFNALKPDFVLFGGDQVETVGKDDANWNLFGDVVQQLQVPWSFVLGEEDVAGRVPPDKMRTFGSDWRARGIETTEPYWSLNPVPGVHLVGLDSSLPNMNEGQFSESQLTWLKEDLAKNKGKFTIVFSHHPLLPPPPYDGGPPWSDYAAPNGADAREVLATSSDVRLVVSGHLYCNKVQIERDVWHVASAGLNVYPCQYKLFRVSRTGIIMESFPVAFPALVKKARKALVDSTLAFKYNNKNPESFVQLCEGTREDQDAFLSLTGSKTPQPLSKKDKTNLEAKTEKGKGKGKDKDKGKGAKDSGKEREKAKGKSSDESPKAGEKSKGKGKKESSKDADKKSPSSEDKDLKESPKETGNNGQQVDSKPSSSDSAVPADGPNDQKAPAADSITDPPKDGSASPADKKD